MIWMLFGLCVLCIAMSCVALWYRGKRDKTLDDLADCIEENNDLRDSRDWHKKECDRLLSSIGALNIEVDTTKERLKQAELVCNLLRKEIEAKEELNSMLLKENKRVCSQLPKRDSKGRFCKK